MLHKLFNLTRPLIIFDTETTGTNVQKDRIVELSFKLYTAEGLQKSWRGLINPTIPIPESVSRIHGITNERMDRCRICDQYPISCTCTDTFHPIPKFSQLAASFARGFTDCDYGGQNIRFDLRILYEEMARAKIEWSYATARIIDTGRLEQLVEPRTLSDLYRKYTGQDLDGAHGAEADVLGVIEVLEGQLTRHAALLPRDLDALHQLQWPDYITAEGQFRFVDGVPTCCFGTKYRDEPIEKIPRDFWDWVLRKDFPADVKQVARNAKLGKYPVKEELLCDTAKSSISEAAAASSETKLTQSFENLAVTQTAESRETAQEPL